jgi:purine-nucleoside phosphorylase
MTPEQEEAVKREMSTVLGLTEVEVAHRFTFARHAATQAPSIDRIVDDLARLFQEKLTREERRDLAGMLDRVAALHGGPTLEQERAVALANRRFAEAV